MRVVILAAGRGARLRPLTDRVPKPLLPIAGRPVIETLVGGLVAAGLPEMIVVVGHLGDRIQAALGNGSRLGAQIVYAHQPEPLGQVDAVAAAQGVLGDPAEVLVAAGDTAFDAHHIQGLVKFHRRTRADVSLSLKRLPPEKLAQTSSVALGARGRVRAIIEKPAPGEALSDAACAPLHIYPRAALDLLPQVPLSPRAEYELSDLIALLIERGSDVRGLIAPAAPTLTDLHDLLRLNFAYLADYF